MARAGTIREARSNVVKTARLINEQRSTGLVSDETLSVLAEHLSELDARTAASNASRKKAE
jgi:hypothetical protein